MRVKHLPGGTQSECLPRRLTTGDPAPAECRSCGPRVAADHTRLAGIQSLYGDRPDRSAVWSVVPATAKWKVDATRELVAYVVRAGVQKAPRHEQLGP